MAQRLLPLQAIVVEEASSPAQRHRPDPVVLVRRERHETARVERYPLEVDILLPEQANLSAIIDNMAAVLPLDQRQRHKLLLDPVRNDVHRLPVPTLLDRNRTRRMTASQLRIRRRGRASHERRPVNEP